MNNNKVKEILQKVNELKIKLGNTLDFVEENKLKAEIYELKAKAHRMLIDGKSKRPSISAKELLAKKLKEPIYFETGIFAIDTKLKGIPLGALVQIAASSGAGKTTLMLKILSTFAKTQKVVHFDFEMGDIKLARKLNKLLTTDEQLENYIIDFQSYKLEDLVREIELYSAQGIHFFVIDSRMKIQTDEKFIADSTAKISSELQRLCRENNITIMLINQMSEEALKNGRAVLKGGNDQFYDADIVMFLYKPLLNRGKDGLPDEYDDTRRVFVVSKNRFGKEYTDEIRKNEVESTQVEIEVNEYNMECPF